MNMSKHTELTTLTLSYDLYHFLWPDYCKLFNKYWKPNTHNIVIGETLSETSSSKNFEFITPGKMLNNNGKDMWGKRVLHALDYVTTPYVFVMMVDYYLAEDLSEEFIEQQINFLKHNNANKIVLDIDQPSYSLDKSTPPYYKFNNDSVYQTTLMPAIWKTDWLRSLIDENDTPWTFEIEGTGKIQGHDNNVYLHDMGSPMFYNVIRKNRYIPKTWDPNDQTRTWEEFKEKEQLKDPCTISSFKIFKE